MCNFEASKLVLSRGWLNCKVFSRNTGASQIWGYIFWGYRGYIGLCRNIYICTYIYIYGLGFPQNLGYLFGGPHNKNSSILGSILIYIGVLLFRETTS